MNNPFWDYSLTAYSREGVAAVCLELQDLSGLDVNMLLYAAWLASMNQSLTAPHLAALDDAVKDWRNAVVKPLRQLRVELRRYPSAAVIREDLKALELRVEHQQQDFMYDMHCAAGVQPAKNQPLRENLVQVAELSCAGEASWRSPLEQLSTFWAS